MPGIPDKEASAFVNRLEARLKSDPRASLSGRHRAAFIAVRPLVEAALSNGYTMKATWDALRAEGKLSMTYETFRSHCGRLRIGRDRRGAVGDSGAPAREQAKPADRARPHPVDAARSGEQPQGFQHERVPQKDEIY